MAKVFGIAKIKNDGNKKLVSVVDNNQSINITEYMENILKEYITNNTFYEKYKNEYEKITYETIKCNKLKKLYSYLIEVKNIIYDKQKSSLSLEDKDHIFLELKNISMLESVIMNYLLKDHSKNEYILLFY